MKCPKCAHVFTSRKRSKLPALPVTESDPETVFPQPCWGCERPLATGEHVYASACMPVSVCPDCRINREWSRTAGFVSAVVGNPDGSRATVPADPVPVAVPA